MLLIFSKISPLSHFEERKEKVCLNCKTELYGRYCHVCGQENIEPKESVWHLVNHFFEDITHFDGKFFSTVKYLLAKPGFLSKEYMTGRRASYLNPIRMYVFTSAIFFLILFSLPDTGGIMKFNEAPDKTEKKEGIGDWEKQIAKLETGLKNNKDKSDSADVADDVKERKDKIAAVKKIFGDTSTKKFDEKGIALLLVRANLDSLKKDGMPADVLNNMNNALSKDSSSDENSVEFSGKKYKTPEAYDSVQEKLSENLRDGWFKSFFKRRMIKLNYQIHKDKSAFIEHVKENFLHLFPKIFFISLPFFALILELVYIRRKQYYYANHGIFAIHLYCAGFILLLVLLLANQLHDFAAWEWLQIIASIIATLVWIFILIYTYKAMKFFYGQGTGKTFLKFCIVTFLAFVVNITLFVLAGFISAVSVK